MTRRFRSLLPALVVVVLAHAAAAPDLSAQAAGDSTAVVDTTGPRPERRPPLSPRRAFLYSLAVPGYAQSKLNRSRAGAMFMAFEAAALVMIRQSGADIREANRNLADSVVVSFVNAAGNPEIRWEPTPFSSLLARRRRSHLEDWVAVLLANHLFAAADAYVASLLWDLPAELALRTDRRNASLSLRLRW